MVTFGHFHKTFSQGKMYPDLILKGQQLWQIKKMYWHYIYWQLLFSKPICQNRPGNLWCWTQPHLPWGLRWEEVKQAHSHPHTQLFMVSGSQQPSFIRSAEDDDDLCFSMCMVSLRHCTMMNSLSSHCRALMHIFQSQKSQTEIWAPRDVNHHFLIES